MISLSVDNGCMENTESGNGNGNRNRTRTGLIKTEDI